MSRRFSSERDIVTSSANSRSLPTGMPMAMRVTRGPKRLQQAREIDCRRFAFDGGIRRQDDFFYLILVQSVHQSLDA